MVAELSSVQVVDAVVLINRYSREILESTGRKATASAIADRMGWTVRQLVDFRKEFKDLLDNDQQITELLPERIQPPSEAEIMDARPELPAEVISDEQLASMLDSQETELQTGLKRIGFTDEESIEAEALQDFNRKHFKESMDMVSANVMRTSMKLSIQQRKIEGRLENVRDRLIVIGDNISDERAAWVQEERMLLAQYIDVGGLLQRIQETWYRGAAVIALARMRHGRQGENQHAQLGKPKFKPMLTNR